LYLVPFVEGVHCSWVGEKVWVRKWYRVRNALLHITLLQGVQWLSLCGSELCLLQFCFMWNWKRQTV